MAAPPSGVTSLPSGGPSGDDARLDPFHGLAGEEVTHLFDAQATMLRRLVASNATLRDEWRRSKAKLLLSPSVGEENAITLGEAHVLVELQVANTSLNAHVETLKAQLELKTRELQASQLECAKLRAVASSPRGLAEAR